MEPSTSRIPEPSVSTHLWIDSLRKWMWKMSASPAPKHSNRISAFTGSQNPLVASTLATWKSLGIIIPCLRYKIFFYITSKIRKAKYGQEANSPSKVSQIFPRYEAPLHLAGPISPRRNLNLNKSQKVTNPIPILWWRKNSEVAITCLDFDPIIAIPKVWKTKPYENSAVMIYFSIILVITIPFPNHDTSSQILGVPNFRNLKIGAGFWH